MGMDSSSSASEEKERSPDTPPSAMDAETVAGADVDGDADADRDVEAEMDARSGGRRRDGDKLARLPSAVDSIWVAESLSLPREALMVALVCMAQFCTQSAFLGTLVILRTIGETFDVDDPPQLAWLVAGYSLTVGTFILFSGRLGDIFGYKRMLVIGLVWFSVWSCITGLSVYSNFTLAVFSRVLQGIGPAICLPNALAIFGTAYPPGHRKAMVFAFFGAVGPIGAVVGGTFASVLTMAWWPWAFWVLAMWLAVMAVTAHFVIPKIPSKTIPPKDLKTWVQVLDLPGAFVGVVALVLFNFAWTQAPINGWATPTVLVPLVLGLVLFGIFAFIESKVAMPLLPFAAVTGDVAFVLASMVCGWATFGIWTLYTVQLLQDIRHLSPILTTAWFAPVAVAGCCASVVTGKLLGPWQVKPSMVMSGALLAFTVGSLLTSLAPTNQVYWGQIFVAMIIMPCGIDMSFPAATLIVSNAVAKEHQGIGASLVNTITNYGIALGVGFAGTVEVHIHGDGKTEDERLRGYRGALYMGVGLAGLGLLVCFAFMLRDYLIRRKSGKGS